MVIIGSERFLLLKLMNGLYSVSLAENALNTQKFLSKLILLLKYDTSEDLKLVRVKEELDMIRLFIELLNVSSGNSWDIVAEISDAELLQICIPQKSLLLSIQDMLLHAEVTAGERRSMFLRVSKDGDFAIISIGNIFPPGSNRIHTTLKELEKSFRSLWNTSVCLEESCNETQAGIIMIKIPLEKCW